MNYNEETGNIGKTNHPNIFPTVDLTQDTVAREADATPPETGPPAVTLTDAQARRVLALQCARLVLRSTKVLGAEAVDAYDLREIADWILAEPEPTRHSLLGAGADQRESALDEEDFNAIQDLGADREDFAFPQPVPLMKLRRGDRLKGGDEVLTQPMYDSYNHAIIVSLHADGHAWSRGYPADDTAMVKSRLRTELVKGHDLRTGDRLDVDGRNWTVLGVPRAEDGVVNYVLQDDKGRTRQYSVLPEDEIRIYTRKHDSSSAG